MKVSSRYRPVADAESRRRADRLIAWLRSYAETRLNSRMIDERRCIPPHVALDFGNHGVFGMQVEEAYGGLGLRNRDVARVLEQAAAIDLGLGTWILTSLFPGVRPIAAFAGEDLKRRWLPALAAGRALAGYAQTEPGAGTHFAAMSAEALAEGAGGPWKISGDKVWIGNAAWASVLTVVAHDVDPGGRRRGLTAFAVAADQPGLQPGAEMLSMGMRGMVQSAVHLRDVVVGEDAILGERGRGLDVGVDSMSFSRFAIAATCIGSLKRSVQLAARFGARRSIATGRLLDHPVTLASIGEAACQVRCAEAILYFVADELDADRPVPAELFAIAKVAGSEFLCQTADRLVQLLGSRGYDEANGVPQLLRDARVTRIFEGATEALLAYVGSQALTRTSELYASLREGLEAVDLAERLEKAVGALRGRGSAAAPGRPALPLARTWQVELAGWAALWTVLAAATRRRAERDDDASCAAAADWALLRLEEASRSASDGDARERLLGDAAGAEAIVASFAGDIGDVDQHLPGERLEPDPLLRRDP